MLLRVIEGNGFLCGHAGRVELSFQPPDDSLCIVRFDLEQWVSEGRGRVKLEIESCPPAVPFEDPSCLSVVSSSWSDTAVTPGGVTLKELVPIPAGQTLSRWRARVLYAPFTVTEAGITPPANPSHGPWRRLFGQHVEADIRRQLTDAAVVGAGAMVTETVLGGTTSWGGVEAFFADTSGGSFSSEFVPIPIGPAIQEVLNDPMGLDFSITTDPVQMWNLEYTGNFTGCSIPQFVDCVELTFNYDDSTLIGPEELFRVLRYTGTSWVVLPVISHDTVGNTITVATDSFSQFVLLPEPAAIVSLLSGVALLSWLHWRRRSPM